MAVNKKASKPASKVAKKPRVKKEFSVGKFSKLDESGTKVITDTEFMRKAAAIKKQAFLFDTGGLGGADIADSDNIGYYSYEFPVDALELPQSRREELKFYRLAYDRDPIAGRAIDLHTELPMSKLVLDKPKSSSENFADYIYDFYSSLINETELFKLLLDATREYWLVGEAFIFVEDPSDVEICEEAKQALNKGMGDPDGSSVGNPAKKVDGLDIIEWVGSDKFGRKKLKEARSLNINIDDSISDLDRQINIKKASIKTKIAKLRVKLASVYKRAIDPVEEDRADSNEQAAEQLRSPLEIQQEKDQAREEAPDVLDKDTGGGAMLPPADRVPDEEITEPTPEDDEGISSDKEDIADLKRYLKLLERKKELLEELKDIREKKEHEYELFSNIVNKEYNGWSKLQLIPPDRVEIKRDTAFGDGPVIFYEPSPAQKDQILADRELDKGIKESIESDGKVPLNNDPLKGSYIIHFARKKAPFEDHGRSILQRCLRTLIYRDKLRQVQTTIVSRNMTPKTLIVAPGVSASQLMELRAHADEAKADPDYTIAVNYECRWEEIGSEGRILALDSEWAHTNADLSTGLGFSPDLLTGEGFYSGNRIHLELLNSTYTLYRETISFMVEDKLFKPIAMKKGFYEIDKYNRPRWIYPKINFSRLALRDAGDVYDMMFNLYQKGSLPIEIIYDFLNVDPESCRRKLEEDLFTVNDSKFNQLLDSVYSAITEKLMEKYDLVERVAEGLKLKETSHEDEDLAGEGEGV